MRDRSISPRCATSLGVVGRHRLQNQLFGEDSFLAPGGRQDRFLRSWMEMGYPDPEHVEGVEGEDEWDSETGAYTEETEETEEAMVIA